MLRVCCKGLIPKIGLACEQPLPQSFYLEKISSESNVSAVIE